ncbi:MAG: YceI family protein [Chloroflexota bacterium]|nr:YceI family protein [Chloroflexota bacterium]
MSRTVRILLALFVVALVVGGAVVAWLWFGGGEASGPITAPAVTAAAGATTFSIVQDESEARFLLDEDLRGERITVVGATDQVAGQIAVDFANPAASTVGTIRINARGLATDQEFRNRAIRTAILQTGDYEFIEFVPTAVNGLPASVTIGTPFSFQIVGDLTIRNITQSVTFETTVTPVSETRIEGLATTLVTLEQYQLTIPEVPSVANVEDEIELELQFVATAGTAAADAEPTAAG